MKKHSANPSLSSLDAHRLLAAEGWLELGNYLEANAELDEITPSQLAHPDVLSLRWHVYSDAKRWDGAVEIASTLVQILPDNAEHWLHRSYALHELKRTQEAFDSLLPVAKKFPTTWLIPYNLACYTAQLGRLDECQDWFKKAMVIAEHPVKHAAVDDPDLKPLWDSMSGSLWRPGKE